MEQREKIFYKVILTVMGITIISIGLTFMRYAVLGLDPASCLNTGVSKKLGISFGTWALILYSIMLIGMFIFDRSKIGFGTLYNLITVGYTSDFLLWIINKIAIFESFSIQTRIISFIAGILILYFGAAIYIVTNMGLGPYDAIAVIISDKIKRPNWFKWIRIGTDGLCVLGGILTQSDVGVGTLITVLFAGPLIAFYIKLITKLKIFQIIMY